MTTDHRIVVHLVIPPWASGDSVATSRSQISNLLIGVETFLGRKTIPWDFFPGDVLCENTSWEAVARAIKSRRNFARNEIHLAFVDGASGPRGLGDIVPLGQDPTVGNRMSIVFKPAGWVPGVVAHELFHALGAVHPLAPSAAQDAWRHTNGLFAQDLMYYGGGIDDRVSIDTQGDSYYNAKPVVGGWLKENPKFNIYHSPFLGTVPGAEPDPIETPMFSDIESHPLRSHIERAAKAGIIHGYPDGTFRPQDRLTRAQGAALIARVLDYIDSKGE